MLEKRVVWIQREQQILSLYLLYVDVHNKTQISSPDCVSRSRGIHSLPFIVPITSGTYQRHAGSKHRLRKPMQVFIYSFGISNPYLCCQTSRSWQKETNRGEAQRIGFWFQRSLFAGAMAYILSMRPLPGE